MYLKLQIIFTILSAIFVAGVFPLGILIDWNAAIVSALAAFLFFSLMYVCKQKNKSLHPEDYEEPESSEAPDEEKKDE
ncbi:MAG: hypothetical protein IJ506_03225 [Clostridia bacterium]|nr:hypothetical protein [Clostridia bacterium]